MAETRGTRHLSAIAFAVVAAHGVALVACDRGGFVSEAEKKAREIRFLGPLDRVTRVEFNRIAAELAEPIFWTEDKDKNGSISPDELAVLWGLRATKHEDWIAENQFKPAFIQAYERIVKIKTEGHPTQGLDEAEVKRRKAVVKELSQGRPTIVLSSFKGSSPQDRAIVKNIMWAARSIEKLYAKQRGAAGMAEKVPADDTMSRMLFYRNQAPWCAAPETENDPDCSGLATKPKKISGLYPESLQASDPSFCETLEKRKDADDLFAPFAVVREDGPGKLKAVPYNVEYKEDMDAVARTLDEAALAIKSEDEAALKTYLMAAAESFRSNEWLGADEAWSKMNSQNSKWYLRIAPDEVYFEPCSRKAAFHVSFARINQASVDWQTKLDPLKNEMEGAIAAAAGKPYKARTVSFHLPDFVDIILNAGEARPETGATVGQSLPNWGPVANEGRGRTVAMTNFYTDADSRSALHSQVESLFCAGSMAGYSDDYSLQLMETVLHEAAHNLGPSHEYKVGGKTDDQIFGGPLATVLDELKAQTGSDFFTDWLVEKGVITKEVADKAHVSNIVWGFGHISLGMYSDKKPRPFSQLAAIQLGFLMKEGAVTWAPEEMAANKSDKGCFQISVDKIPPAYKKLMAAVAGIKGRGDKKAALAMVKELVDQEGQTQQLFTTIKERWLRSPKASFVYGIEL